MKMLEFARRTKGLSQADLAKKVLYSRSVISRLESCPVNPTEVHPRLRKALEAYFGRPLEDLLTEVETAALEGTKSADAHEVMA